MTDTASPWSILGLDPEASTVEIRASYTALVKRHPPDRDPAAFERIRDAYLAVKDPRVLAREKILGPGTLGSLDQLVEAFTPQRRPADAAAWIEALKELSR